MAAFDVIDELEELQVITQRTSDRTEAADVLRVAPPRIVPAAVGVRDVRDRQDRTGRRRRNVTSNVEPSMAPVCETGTLSSRISYPLSFTTKSASEWSSG